MVAVRGMCGWLPWDMFTITNLYNLQKLLLSIPLIFLKSGIDKLDGMVDDTSISLDLTEG